MRSRLSDLVRFQLPIWLVMPMLGLTLVLGLGGGYLGALQITSPCPQSPEVCARFANFWKAWNIASDNYVDPTAIDPQRMTDGAIEGMLDSLGDQGHTVYLSPESARAEREALSGRFEGIGAYVQARDDRLYLNPIEGLPAERAGVRPGDLVLKIDGQDVTDQTRDEVVTKVRGPKGTQVTLTLLHEGETLPVDITITRDEINVPSVAWQMLANRVALIQLNRFAERSTDEMKQALTDAQAQGATSIVLDLRNNPGGYVNELVGIASQFLPQGTTVLLEQDRTGDRTPKYTAEGGVATSTPLVVLVNNNSASSAEILAGALKDAGRAQVIGVPTFGTATVLSTYDLNDGAQVRIGTTQWLTPKGEVVRGKGIEPNQIVALPIDVAPLSPSDAAKLDSEALLQSKDVQLVRALEVLKDVAKK